MPSIRAGLTGCCCSWLVARSCRAAAHAPERVREQGRLSLRRLQIWKWAATRPLALVDRPGGHPVAKLSEGEQVLAITGEVITHSTPSRIRGDGAYNEGIPAGAVVCLLHPVGEGDWLAWYKGKVVQIEAYDAPDVDYHWWAKIKKASDRVGWVPISALALPFTGADSCG